jgi:hypothetical protein
MRFQSVLFGLSAVSAATAAAVGGAIPEKEIIESLLTNNGFLMLPSGVYYNETFEIHSLQTN